MSGTQGNGNQPGADGGATNKSYKSLCPGLDTVGVNATHHDGAHATPRMGLECPEHALVDTNRFAERGGVIMQKQGTKHVFGRY